MIKNLLKVGTPRRGVLSAASGDAAYIFILVCSFLLSTLLHATGGIGFVNLCTPANIATPQGWWKSDTITNANNTSLTNWIDSSGGSHAAVQTTAALEPKFLTGLFGSAGGVRFTNNNSFSPQNYMDTSSGSAANSITTSGDFTVFCVHVSNATGSSSTSGSICGNAYANGTDVNTVNAQNGDVFQLIDEGPVNNPTSANAGTTTGKTIAGVWMSKGGAAKFFANKLDASTAGSYGTFKFNFVGASASSTINRLNGDMAELVILFKAASGSQILTLYGSYWRPRYSTLP
jgi:hypothetical protein